MARPFSGRQAKTLLADHRQLAERLKDGLAAVEACREQILAACGELAARDVPDVLQGVPVEELGREKPGLRVKVLREAGYETVADVLRADVRRLAAVNGVSPEGAQSLKTIAAAYAARASQGVKIKLSTDDRSPEATRLVQAVYCYQQAKPHAEEGERLLAVYAEPAAAAAADLEPAASGFKWAFAGEDKRRKAADAYDYLDAIFKGEYGVNGSAVIRALKDVSRIGFTTAWKAFAENPVAFYNTLEEVNPAVLGNADAVYGLPEDLAAAVQNEPFYPEGLNCTLRRYQEWGVKYVLHQKKVLLGDEMGLGKTVQAIAVMVSLRNTGATHFLVVCPASVLTNWCREVQKMSDLPVIAIHGDNRDGEFAQWLESGGVGVTTYETTGFLKPDKAFRYALLVVDEAHYIKNPDAQRTQNVVRIGEQAERMLYMTGTALENRVDEMLSLMGRLQPELTESARSMAFLSTAPQFREKIVPVYYRRKRDDVLTELPEKTETKEWCTLLPEEERLYEQAVLSDNYTESRRVSWNIDDLSKSAKAIRLKEIVEEAAEDGRKVLVFSFFLDTLDKVMRLLGERCVGPITGAVPPARRQELVDEFEKAPAGSVLVAQIQSGGTGLNIQSANVVVICEPQFKPSIENQAISRAYRMGQTRRVLVYRLLADDTVDERLTEMLESKQAVFDAFADESVAGDKTLELDEKSFTDIMQQEKTRIGQKNGAPVETAPAPAPVSPTPSV